VEKPLLDLNVDAVKVFPVQSKISVSHVNQGSV
jgi:hypothetical protein